MSVNVYIPTPYRQFTDGASKVEVEADTVELVLAALIDRYPGLKERIWDADTTVPDHLNVYVNKEEIRSLSHTETKVKDGDEVALIPAMAGGAGGQGGLLNEQEMDRYSRHLLLDEVGVTGQRKLLDSRVLVIGAGGLGSPASIYLAAAGVGTIGIVDGDRVETSNLQRQILHFTHDVGRPKTQSAERHLNDINPDVAVKTYNQVITSDNALELIEPYDLVINGSDNFPTRYLVNDACVMLEKPLIDSSILKWEGQATVFVPGGGCYRCLFPSPPPPGTVPSCAEGGIIGALAGHLGTLQVIEAVKVLLGIGDTLNSRLLIYDALHADYNQFPWKPNPDCPVCGDDPEITELIDYEAFCGVPIDNDTSESVSLNGRQEEPGEEKEAVLPEDREVSPERVYQLIEEHGARVVDVREPWEYERFRIDGSTHISLSEISQRADEIDPDQPTVFVCQVGERSAAATNAFRDAGYEKTYNLAGGLVAWMNKELPLQEGEPVGD